MAIFVSSQNDEFVPSSHVSNCRIAGVGQASPKAREFLHFRERGQLTFSTPSLATSFFFVANTAAVGIISKLIAPS